MTIECDVTIVGASLAGSFAALLLAKQGYRIVLLDPGQAPKSKACGEGLSLMGQRYLERAGLWSDSLKGAAVPFFGYGILFADEKKLTLTGKRPIGYGIRRRDLERQMFSAIESHSNLSVVCDRAVTIDQSGDRWSIATSSGLTVRSPHLVMANGLAGRHSSRRANGETPQKSESRYAIAIRAKGSWIGKAPSEVIIGHTTRCQVVITPIFGGINLCALVSANAREGGSVSSQVLQRDAIEFARQCGFSVSEIEQVRGASSVQTSKAVSLQQNMYYVGDTAELFDPIGGMGMSHALFSASIAAEEIDIALRNPAKKLDCWRQYVDRRYRFARIFSLKTNLSYLQNVKQSVILRLFTSMFPKFSFWMLCALEHLLPVTGLVRHLRCTEEGGHFSHEAQSAINHVMS